LASAKATKTVNTNRAYKASVFSSLFREYPGELPKVVPVHIQQGTAIEDVTLDNAIFMEQINDLALRVGSVLLLFFEHQSTSVNNMCVRLLLYCARTYEKLLERRALYQTEKITIPYPYFVALYNGRKDYPDMQTMNLSDSFEDASELLGADLTSTLRCVAPLELTLTVININKGHNSELIAKSEILSGYIEFIDRVTRYKDSGMERSEAITKAVRECISEGILKDYLIHHGSEVENMLITEWDTQMAIEVRAEEAAKKAYEEAKAEDRAEIAQLASDRDRLASERDQFATEHDRIASERDRLAAEVAALRERLGDK
jgi:hypothetical protein